MAVLFCRHHSTTQRSAFFVVHPLCSQSNKQAQSLWNVAKEKGTPAAVDFFGEEIVDFLNDKLEADAGGW
jgi:hypothetical protein